MATVIDRRDHHFGETTVGVAHLLAPPIDLSGAKIGAPGNIGLYPLRRKGRRHNGGFFPLTPRPTSLGTGKNLHAGHLDVSCTGASTDACTSATSGPSCRPSARRPSPEAYFSSR